MLLYRERYGFYAFLVPTKLYVSCLSNEPPLTCTKAGLRNKPSYNPSQYSVEWTGVVTSYMKKQLADIALPSAPRPGMNIKQTFKGVLADSATRERWILRFSYWYGLFFNTYISLINSIQLEASPVVLSGGSSRSSDVSHLGCPSYEHL